MPFVITSVDVKFDFVLSDSTAKTQQINVNKRRENLKKLKATLFIAARQIVVLN